MVNEVTAFVGNFDKENSVILNRTLGESFHESGEILIDGKDIFSHLGLNKTRTLINLDGKDATLDLKAPTQATYNLLKKVGYVLAGYLLPSDDTSWDGKYPESFQALDKVDGEEIILLYLEGDILVKLFFIKNKINKEIQGNQTNFKSLVNQLLNPNK